MIKSIIVMLLVAAFVIKAGEFGQGTVQTASESVATQPASQMSAADVPSSMQTESIPSQSQTLSEFEDRVSYDTDVSEALASEQMASTSQDMTAHDGDNSSPASQEELERQIEGYTQEVDKDTKELKEELSQTADVLKQTGIAPSAASAFEQEGKTIQQDVDKIEATEKEIESAVTGKPMSAPAGKKTMKCVCDVE